MKPAKSTRLPASDKTETHGPVTALPGAGNALIRSLEGGLRFLDGSRPPKRPEARSPQRGKEYQEWCGIDVYSPKHMADIIILAFEDLKDCHWCGGKDYEHSRDCALAAIAHSWSCETPKCDGTKETQWDDECLPCQSKCRECGEILMAPVRDEDARYCSKRCIILAYADEGCSDE